MDMREEHAIWVRIVRERIDTRQQTLDLGTRRVPLADDGRQAAAGEEDQDPGGWEIA